ncbi:MAG: hypothetical protein ACW987_08975 [Candidatus Thorarchaeota archaeon]|jgi:hypothetical protein
MSIIIQSAGTVPHGMTVDKFGRGRVFSTSTTQEHHAASVVAEAFELSTVGGSASPYVPLVIATITDGVVLSIQNQNAAKTMSIQKMVFSADAAGLTVTLVKNMVRGTLANNTSITPPNINFNSGNAASVNADKWDGVGTGITGLTSGTPMSQSTLGVGSTILPIDGSYIIGSGNELSFHVNNPTAGAINLSLSMRFFFESVTA